MLIQDLKKRVQLILSDYLKDFGFNLNKGKTEFKRIISLTENVIGLTFFKEEDGCILLEITVGINIIPIEKIYKEICLNDFKYSIINYTIGNNIFEIIDFFENGESKGGKSVNKKYLISNKEDLLKLEEVLIKRISQFAFKYFENYSTIEHVDRLLNDSPKELSIHSYIYPIRACKAIIAARLNNNPMLLTLINIYEEELKDANPINKKQFDTLKTYLLSNFQ